MARIRGSVGAAKQDFETGWHKYCNDHPEFQPGYLAAELVHGFAKDKDTTKFFGALSVLNKFFTDRDAGPDEGAQQTLVIDRRQTPLEFKGSSASIKRD